jgi:hypothetical protein
MSLLKIVLRFDETRLAADFHIDSTVVLSCVLDRTANHIGHQLHYANILLSYLATSYFVYQLQNSDDLPLGFGVL